MLINKNGEPLGTRISSVVAKELKDLNYNKIVALAPKTFRSCIYTSIEMISIHLQAAD